MNADFLNL